MTAFRRFLAVADRTIDRVNAETFVFRPRREVKNASSTDDPSRDVVTVMAVYSDAAERAQVGTAAGAERVTVSPEISVRSVLLAKVSRADRFERVSDGAVFEVTAVEPDGQGRIVARVVEINP